MSDNLTLSPLDSLHSHQERGGASVIHGEIHQLAVKAREAGCHMAADILERLSYFEAAPDDMPEFWNGVCRTAATIMRKSVVSLVQPASSRDTEIASGHRRLEAMRQAEAESSHPHVEAVARMLATQFWSGHYGRNPEGCSESELEATVNKHWDSFADEAVKIIRTIQSNPEK